MGSRRVAQLEQRIDGIITYLSTNQQSQASTSSSSAALTPESAATSISQTSVSQTAELFVNPPKRRNVNFVSQDGVSFDLLPDFRLTPTQASSYLAQYRTQMMPKYPFVIIDSDINAATLCSQSKCLFWCIMATVAPLSTEAHRNFRHWFRSHLAEEIVVKQHKSVDLLQAILVYLAW